jgi:UDP-2-acetamido-3-amino-2,3-dideoxy-glucuronate N-acetyltransferase
MYIHPTAIVEQGAQIGQGTKIWHFSHVMPSAIIGVNCTIGQNVFIADGVVLGNNVKVQTNVINPRSGVNRRGIYEKTIVKKGCTIGANATIICGNTLHEYSFIGAGSVVTHSVPKYAMFVGNPSRQVAWMSEYGHKLIFNEDGIAVCEESRQKYLLKEEAVIRIS